MDRQVALVTGASRGIGRATSEWLAAHGFAVVGLARSAGEGTFPGTLIACDFADRAATRAALDEVSTRFQVDVLVNNFGVTSRQPLEAIDPDELLRVFDLTVRVALDVTQQLVGGMKARGYGRIVNVVSRTIGGSVERSAYSAAKSALVGCTRSWALELAGHGVTVNAVAPGPVETEMFRRSRPVGSEDERRLLTTIPMRRLGQPAEIAATIGFLASREAGFSTGQVIGVDGGGSISGRS
jgi:NAD(P)-dependent dehydrogenase (short-subunit alcohol dehydrogenase family)